MIFYFSGTGNSRFIAKRIQEKTGDEMYSLNEAIKQKKIFSGKTPETAVFVVPAYAWRIPEIVETWIRKSKFDIGMKAYFVMTCGDGIGNAAKYARKLCEDKVFTYMGCAGILMPENYLAMFRVPSEEEAKNIIADAEPKIRQVEEQILAGDPLTEEPVSMLGAVCSGPVNLLFYPLFVHANKFNVDNCCTGCGKCVKVCPRNNIQLVNGRPQWGDKCTHCMACITQCPAKSIEYGKKSLGKPRYRCPYEK